MSLGLPGFLYDKVSKADLFVGRYHKPGFRYLRATEIICEASATRPAYFIIGGRLYIITEDLTCNLKANGAGGLAGTRTITASTAYYLYGVEHESTVALVADIHDPDDGPEGFPVWTYLGGFRIESTSTLSPFTSSDGILVKNVPSADTTVSDSTIMEYTLIIPTTANKVCMRPLWTAVNAAGDSLSVSGINDVNTANVCVRTNTTTTTLIPVVFFWIEVITPTKIYALTTNAADSVDLYVFGWHENVSEWL